MANKSRVHTDPQNNAYYQAITASLLEAAENRYSMEAATRSERQKNLLMQRRQHIVQELGALEKEQTHIEFTKEQRNDRMHESLSKTMKHAADECIDREMAGYYSEPGRAKVIGRTIGDSFRRVKSVIGMKKKSKERFLLD